MAFSQLRGKARVSHQKLTAKFPTEAAREIGGMSARHRASASWPVVTTACADCGIGTNTLGEWYMVKNEIWDQAWAGRRKSWHALSGQQILCVGCLEKRLGRTLMACDFTDVPVNNDPHTWRKSKRLRDRLQRGRSP
jgi:hypothetical protein